MLEKIKRLFTPLNIFVALLLLIAFFARVYRVDQILNFHYDQGRDALVIWDLINKGKMFLIGPTTGIAGIFRGPFYYYLIAPFYWLGKGNPVWPSVFLAFTSIIALWLMYYLAKKVGGTVTGIIALVLGGFSFEIIYASRWLSNPTPMLLLSMILVWSLFKIYEGNKKYWMLTALALGLSMFHFGSSGEIFYFPAVFIFAIWQRKNFPDLKILIKSIIIFGLTALPLALFDLRHGGILGGNIKGFLVTGNSFSFPTWRFVIDRLTMVTGYLSALIFHGIYEKETLILIGLGSVIIFNLKDLLKNNYFKIILLLIISPIIGLIFFQGNFGNLYAYYLTGYYLIFLLFVSISLGVLFKNSWIGKIIVLGFMWLFLSSNYQYLKGMVLTTGEEKTTIVFANQKKAIDWIYTDAGGKKFNIDEYVPPVIPYSYEYLLKWQSNTNLVDKQVPLLYTLYEVDPPHPERLAAWLKRQDTIGKIEYTKNFGGITVDKRIRIIK